MCFGSRALHALDFIAAALAVVLVFVAVVLVVVVALRIILFFFFCILVFTCICREIFGSAFRALLLFL